MSPIDAVLSALTGGIESALQAASARDTPWIAFGPRPAGPAAGERPDEIRAVVLSVEGDASLGRFDARRLDGAEVMVDRPPTLALDVLVAFVPHFGPDSYLAGLGLMSRLIGALQERPSIEAEIPDGPASATIRLPVDLVSLDLDRRSRAAAMLGAAGEAFVVYRVRRLPFEPASFGALAARVGVGR